jgi:predicted TPR repeat methyltransferase
MAKGRNVASNNANVGWRAPAPAQPAYAVALERAMKAHQAHDLDTAERLYGEVLELRAAQPDALHYLGVLMHQRDRSDEAVALINTSLKITPRHPDAHNNLGNIHTECGRVAAAEACYRRALECGPTHYNALCNLAFVLEVQERPDDAFEAYGELLRKAPTFAHGQYMMGLFLRNYAQNVEHIEQSIACFREAYRLDPRNLRALEGLGISLYTLGRHDEAREVYRDWLEREPHNPIPRHMLAATGGAETPPRADEAYVRNVFDSFADSFDEQLLKNLDYRAPEVLAEALGKVLPAADGSLDVLDAGCGTGLCAPLLRPHARTLVGVDLSGGMIEKARARGGYDELVVAELTAYLQAHPSAYDVVISADTLIYFGDLAPVLQAAHGALRQGGWLAFTLEVLEGEGDRYALSSSGRYQHTRDHTQAVVESAGFDRVTIGTDMLRKEHGKIVSGWVVLARRGGNDMR